MEVEAYDHVGARYAGFDQFKARCSYEPILRRRMQDMRLATEDCCAPDAVELDD